jgi:hypothetical protein
MHLVARNRVEVVDWCLPLNPNLLAIYGGDQARWCFWGFSGFECDFWGEGLAESKHVLDPVPENVSLTRHSGHDVLAIQLFTGVARLLIENVSCSLVRLQIVARDFGLACLNTVALYFWHHDCD